MKRNRNHRGRRGNEIQKKGLVVVPIEKAMTELGEVCRDTVYRLIRPRKVGKKIEKPKIRSFKHGRRRLVVLADCRKYMRSLPEVPLSPYEPRKPKEKSDE